MAAGSSLFLRVGVMVCGAVLSAVLGTGGVAQGQAAITSGTGTLTTNIGYATVPPGSMQEVSFQSTSSNRGDFAPGTIVRQAAATQLVTQPIVAERLTGPVVVPAGTVAGTVDASSTTLFAGTGVSGSFQTEVELADLGTQVRNMSIVTNGQYWTFQVFQPTEFSLFVRSFVPTGGEPAVLAGCWTNYSIVFEYRQDRLPTPNPLSGVLTSSGETSIRGVLQPDTYIFSVSSYDTYLTSTSTRTVDFSFTLIPSPAPTATLALGLLTLARRRR
ncbi:MAG: hypothetical protein ACK54T_10200 [bacterium]